MSHLQSVIDHNETHWEFLCTCYGCQYALSRVGKLEGRASWSNGMSPDYNYFRCCRVLGKHQMWVLEATAHLDCSASLLACLACTGRFQLKLCCIVGSGISNKLDALGHVNVHSMFLMLATSCEGCQQGTLHAWSV